MPRKKTKPRLVYGEWWLHQSLAVWPEEAARRRAEEISRLAGCTTVGELRALAPSLTDPSVEGFLENVDDAEQPDDAPWSSRETGAAQDGDWPGMPTQQILDLLPGPELDAIFEATNAEYFETTLNGPYVHIPPSDSSALEDVLRSLGYEVIRDDSLIDSLGET